MEPQASEPWVKRWSPENRLGVEWELGMVDANFALVEKGGTRVLNEIRATDPNSESWLHDELFSHTLEVVTPPSDTVAEAMAFLGEKAKQIRAVAAKSGMSLFCAGTHPFSKAENYSMTEDARRISRASRIGVGPNPMQIWSVHVHVGVSSPEAAIAAMRELHAHLPYFYALTGSSPYWEGHDTGLVASRPAVHDSRPFRGVPPLFESWEQYNRTAQSLQLAKRISHPKDLTWEIRITPYGTVELRSCDGIASLQEIGAVTALAHSLVVRAEQRVREGEPLREIDEIMFDGNRRMAMRYGMGARLVTPDGETYRLRERLPALIEELTATARDLGCLDELKFVQTMSDRYTIDETSAPAAARQRSAAQAAQDLSAAVQQNVAELDASLTKGLGQAQTSVKRSVAPTPSPPANVRVTGATLS